MIGRKWVYVLPNAFTVSSIFCGIYAMSLVSGQPTSDSFFRAALAIVFGMLFDGVDGRVARLTKTESDFGMQLDSLADVITFGAAPALLLYKWALEPLGFAGLFIAFSFAACGALRLARFNVLEMRGQKGSSDFFVGLPIPLAAGMAVSIVIAHNRGFGDQLPPAWPVAAMTLLLSFLMVSTVRYRTFKKAKLSRRSLGMAGLLATTALVIAVQYRASFAFVTLASLYVVMGLVEGVVGFGRRRAERRAAARAAAMTSGRVASVEDEEDEDEDDELESDEDGEAPRA